MSSVNVHPDQEVEQPEEHETGPTDVDNCPECNGDLVSDEEHGETICEGCGLVVEDEELDRGPEWRSFDDEDDEKSRVGAPTTKLMHDEGISSEIGWSDTDARGNTLGPRQRKKMQRLRTWDERFRTKDSRERNLKQALGEIERMGSALGVPEDIREMAAVIYRRALEDDLLPGRSIESISSAALYAAARQAGTPRSLDEMDHVSRVEQQKLERAYRYIVRELDLEVQPADPTDYLPRLASELGVSEQVVQRARRLLQTADDPTIHAGKNPVGLAAAALYAAALLCDEKVTQKEVGSAADISQVTIRNRYHELLEASEYDVEPG